eukprot:CAMPEP_0206154436 /NCGR_PEP_ID=MMETSP1474-20131121/1376_1 /ASSEMBLY_ACC=CAM_ASM_001110 /TAXON_ID=97495 /ORGANISM="Imantonia sp., Strain RCC918" /LENGTH=40 /DNA_ID= /DNA_START= /DNA_END= /DNA_ORIENTATION=
MASSSNLSRPPERPPLSWKPGAEEHAARDVCVRVAATASP